VCFMPVKRGGVRLKGHPGLSLEATLRHRASRDLLWTYSELQLLRISVGIKVSSFKNMKAYSLKY